MQNWKIINEKPCIFTPGLNKMIRTKVSSYMKLFSKNFMCPDMVVSSTKKCEQFIYST